jgi:sortase A
MVLQTLDGREIDYQLVESHVIDVRTDQFAIGDYSALTLMTCYPFDALAPGGPLRYLAIAVPTAQIRSSKF